MSKNLEYELEFTSTARQDIREIALWYRNEQEGLEDRFLLSLRASIDKLLKSPNIYQVNFNSVRSLLLKRFPYRLYFIIEDGSIIVLGVIHAKRNPKLIRKRIK